MKKIIFILLSVNTFLFGWSLFGDSFSNGMSAYESHNYQKSKKIFEELCMHQNGKACFWLAIQYRLGYGVKLDNSKSANLHSKACDYGYYDSCVSLGHDYMEGKGVKKDKQIALNLFEKSCKKGNMSGCNSLAFFYEKKMMFSKAKQLWGTFCDSGSQYACEQYARLQQRGY